MSHVSEYCCPSCGVVVLSGSAIAENPDTGEDVCLLCAPYDRDREDLALLLLRDALDQSFCSTDSPEMGDRQPQPPSRPSNVLIAPDQAKMAIEFNDFSKMVLDILYGDAKPKSANAMVLDSGKKAIEHVSRMIRAKLLDPGSAMRQSPLIISKEDTDRYLGILELLHTRYTPAHKAFVEGSRNPEESKRLSYAMFWHMGSLVRSGQLANTISPWITGEQKPRF